MSTEPPAEGRPGPREPWSLQWVAVAILAFVVFYTAINLAFRKQEPAYEPYQATQERRQTLTQRLVMGWAMVNPQPAPADAALLPPDGHAPTPARLDRVFPAELVYIIPRPPDLIPGVADPRVGWPGDEALPAVTIEFALPADAPAAGDLRLPGYYKDHAVHIVFEKSSGPGTLPALDNPASITARFPLPATAAGAPLGVYLYTGDTIFSWTLPAAEGTEGN